MVELVGRQALAYAGGHPAGGEEKVVRVIRKPRGRDRRLGAVYEELKGSERDGSWCCGSVSLEGNDEVGSRQVKRGGTCMFTKMRLEVSMLEVEVAFCSRSTSLARPRTGFIDIAMTTPRYLLVPRRPTIQSTR